MPNKLKLSTFLYIAAALFLPRLLLPFAGQIGLNVGLVHLWIITIPVFGFLAYRSFRKGSKPASLLADTKASPTPSSSSRTNPPRKLIIAGIAVALIAIIGYSVKAGRIFIQGMSMPPIEGAYRDENGGKVEFMSNGTVIATKGNNTSTAHWSRMDNTRLRLEPEQIGFLGQVCEYRFRSYSEFLISNCDFRMTLTRM